MRCHEHTRIVLRAAALSLAGMILAAPAAASVHPRIAKECTRREQPGVLSSRFSEAELRAARRALADPATKHGRCWTAVESQLAWYRGPRGRANEIVDDCLRHYGALTHRYSARALSAALTRATPELQQETHCASGMASQLNVARRGGKVARAQAPAPGSSIPLTRDALIERHRILRRPVREDDQPSDAMAAVYRETVNDPGSTVDGARAVRGLNGMVMHVLATQASGICLLADFTQSAATYAVICQGGGAESAAGVFRAPGGVMLVALLLDGAGAAQAVDAQGRWRTAKATDGVVTTVFRRTPRLFRVKGSDGRVHYTDLNMAW